MVTILHCLLLVIHSDILFYFYRILTSKLITDASSFAAEWDFILIQSKVFWDNIRNKFMELVFIFLQCTLGSRFTNYVLWLILSMMSWVHNVQLWNNISSERSWLYFVNFCRAKEIEDVLTGALRVLYKANLNYKVLAIRTLHST